MLQLILGNGLSFENLIINNPHLFINRSSEGNSKDPEKGNKKNSKGNKLFSILPKQLKPLSFEKISINFLTLSQIIRNKEYQDSVRKFFVSAEGLKIDSSIIEDSLSLKFASSLDIFIEGFSYHFNDDYFLRFDTLSSSSSDSVFIIRGISYKPYLSDSDFFNHRRFSSDRYIIKAPFISANGIDFKKLIWSGGYTARYIEAKDLILNICTNKRAPPDTNSVPKMPNEIMRSAGRDIDIKNLNLRNWVLHIMARHPNVKEYSDVTFTNVNGNIKNLSNIPGLQSEENPCMISVSANLYDSAKLSLEMKLPLLVKNLSFDYTGNLTSMSVLPINNQIEPADHVKLTSGEIDSVSFSIHVLKSAADVYVRPIYKNLKIEQLKDNAKKGGILKKAGSFIANKFVMRTSNPDDKGEIKTGSIIYSKEKGDTFLDVVWTALKKGLGEVVGF